MTLAHVTYLLTVNVRAMECKLLWPGTKRLEDGVRLGTKDVGMGTALKNVREWVGDWTR